MADLYTYTDSTGLITTDTENLQAEVQLEFQNALGSDINLSPSTPQGVLITAETLARAAVVDNNAAVANQINPNLAGGVFLDAILALTGTARTAATRSTLTATLNGVAGTIIPAGSQASETGSGDANVFETVSQVTIPVGGSITGVAFQSVETGPIPAALGTLTTIISNVLGWESISGSSAAVLGQSTQSDVAARQYRLQTLAAQGQSTAQAIIAAVTAVEGVTSVSFRENIADTTQVIDGVTMVAHSIYVCVAGTFSNDDVAAAIVSKKSAGAAFNNGASGNPQSVNVTEAYSGQVITVLFDIADNVAISVQGTVSASTSVQDPEGSAQDAIVAYASGEISGEPGFIIGGAVSPFELAGAVVSQYPGIFVHQMETKKTIGGTFSTDEIPIEIWEIPTVTASAIVITNT